MISNPPFLGGKLLITHLGEEYVSRMFATYAGRVPAEADLVCYWFEKAGQQIASGKAARAGLGATNSIRSHANRCCASVNYRSSTHVLVSESIWYCTIPRHVSSIGSTGTAANALW